MYLFSTTVSRAMQWGALVFATLQANLYCSEVVPSYKLNQSVLNIRSVAAVRNDAQDVFSVDYLNVEPTQNPNAVGRSSRLLSPREFNDLNIRIPANYPFTATAEEEGMFVLWKIGEDAGHFFKNAAALAFDLSTDLATTAYLGIGADHRYVVLVNGKPIFARAGYDYHLVCSNIVPLPLQAGLNRITIIAACIQRPAAARYFAPPWELSLYLFADKENALKFHDLKNRHCLDTPIVRSADDFYCINGSPIFQEARLLDASGAQLARGLVREDGLIKWDVAVPNTVRYGRVEIDGRRSDPVIICAADELDDFVKNVELDNGFKPNDPWSFRVRHLLKAEFVTMRPSESRWARKFVAAFHKAAFYATSTNFAEPQARPSFEFGSFISAIDGTQQYYIYYIPRSFAGADTRNSPVVAVLPSVPSPVRPFLEGSTLAGSEQLEQWCSVADSTGVSLIWPGYVDVDYGGPIAQAELTEVIHDFYRGHPEAGSLNLMGICSSAVAAMQFVQCNPGLVDGVLLHAPVLSKRTRRYTPDLWGQPIPSSFLPLSTAELMGDFKAKRCALIVDSGMPGHGEPTAIPFFIEHLEKMRVPVARLGQSMTQEYLWGERMNWRIEKFFNWVRAGASNTSSLGKATKPATGSERLPSSVQQLLLSGFEVHSEDAALAQDWLEWWSSQYAKWRGVGPVIQPRPTSKARRVVLKVESLDVIRSHAVFEQQFGVEKQPPRLFAVYIDSATGEVVVAHTSQTSAPYPKVDVMIDGGFRSAVWKQNENGDWKLLNIVY